MGHAFQLLAPSYHIAGNLAGWTHDGYPTLNRRNLTLEGTDVKKWAISVKKHKFALCFGLRGVPSGGSELGVGSQNRFRIWQPRPAMV